MTNSDALIKLIQFKIAHFILGVRKNNIYRTLTITTKHRCNQSFRVMSVMCELFLLLLDDTANLQKALMIAKR